MPENKYITRSRIPFFQLAKELIKKDSIVLDIGAGNGDFATFCSIPSMHMVDANNASSSRNQFPNYKNAILPNLPYEDLYFDIIHCSHVIEHLEPSEFYASLCEMDRCLKNNGTIIISTPIMSDFFYDELSHIKPYQPAIFYKYLTNLKTENLSRPKISNKYLVVKLVYRYDAKKIMHFENSNNNKIVHLINKFFGFLKIIGIRKIIKTGYTIVIQKSL